MLTARSDLQHNVDWIEEVIRRFSVAWENKNSFYSVNMRSPMTTRAVCHAYSSITCPDDVDSGRKKQGTEIRSGARLKKLSSTSLCESITRNFVTSVQI
jgi:hypothetical protein